LEGKVAEKLLPMAAVLDLDGSPEDEELARLLDRAAHHIGTARAGKSYCEQKVCYQTFVHHAEVYFGVSLDSLQLLIEDVNAYTCENRDLLKRAQPRSDPRLRSMLEQERTRFQGKVSVHHREHFGKLEAHLAEAMSGCFQPLNGFCCSRSTVDEHEIERI